MAASATTPAAATSGPWRRRPKPVRTDLGRRRDEGKRLLASAWIWTSITQGDHIYAPAVRPVLDGRRPGGKLGRYVHQRWRFMDSGHDGHYGALRERLNPYANRLAARIDAGFACPAAGPCGQSAFANL